MTGGGNGSSGELKDGARLGAEGTAVITHESGWRVQFELGKDSKGRVKWLKGGGRFEEDGKQFGESG